MKVFLCVEYYDNGCSVSELPIKIVDSEEKAKAWVAKCTDIHRQEWRGSGGFGYDEYKLE